VDVDGMTGWQVSRLGRRGFCAAAAVSALLLVLTLSATARADTPFGGDPAQAATPLSCAQGAGIFGFGAPSCMWWWLHIGVGGDFVPFPTAGGSGVITSVTLPAMLNPGPMQVVVLTAELRSTGDPAHAESICCQVKQIGPTFTVPANQVATVPQNLAVSAQKEANVSVPGETSLGDIVAISVLSPTASLPVRYTGATSVSSPGGADFDSVYYPAPTATNGEFVQPTDPSGYQMLARFNLGATPAPPAPAPPAGANGGLKLGNKPLQVGPDGKTLALGKATNPPTAGTTQTLTAPAGGARAASAGASRAKTVQLGRGKTTVPAGKTVGIKLSLNSTARAKLKKKGTLKATLTIVATNPQGEAQTTTKSITIKQRPPRHKKKH
jgi:hypothetical protein